MPRKDLETRGNTASPKKGKAPPFDLAALADRTLRGKPETLVWIEQPREEPDEKGVIATIVGHLAFARVGPKQRLRMLEPGSEEWSEHGEWPNLWWGFSGTLAVSRAGLVLRTIILAPVEREDPNQDTEGFLGVNSALLRALRPDLIIRLALESLAEGRKSIERAQAHRERYSAGWLDIWQQRDAQLAGAIAGAERAYTETRRAGGRPPLGETHYRAVAYACIKLYQSDHRAGIHAALAQRYHVSPKTIEAWIREARRRHFLAPGQAGRATFVPGPKLKQNAERELG